MANRLLQVIGIVIVLCAPAPVLADILFGNNTDKTPAASSYIEPPQVVSSDKFKSSMNQAQQNQSSTKSLIPPLPAPSSPPTVNKAPAPIERPPAPPIAASTEALPPPVQDRPKSIAVPESLNSTAPISAPSTTRSQEPVYTGFSNDNSSGSSNSSSEEPGWNVKY